MEFIVEVQERREKQRFFTLVDAMSYAQDLVSREFLVSVYPTTSAFRPGQQVPAP